MSLTPREMVIQDLLDEQKKSGYISADALKTLSAESGVSVAELRGIASFYSRFRLSPSGAHTISVCTGTACHVKGAGEIHDAFRSWLRIPEGADTDPDGIFTVDKVACLGCCMIAPAVQIDEVVYGKLTPFDVPSVLADFLESEEAAIDADDVINKGRAPQGAGGRAENIVADRAATAENAPPAGRRRMPRKKLRGEIRICLCSSCTAAGSRRVWEAFRGYDRDFTLKSVGCTGVSYEAPSIEVVGASGASCRYGRILPEQAHLIVERHFKGTGLAGRLSGIPGGVARRLLAEPALQKVTRYIIQSEGPSGEAAYWTRQTRIVTEGYGKLHPLDIDEYRGAGGLSALERAIGMTPSRIIEEIEASGLRGRGGGGFPTSAKWRAVSETADGPRFIVCNGDEGDPGAFMDRMLLESFPFRVIEGMAIAALAVGAEEGVLYIRSEYPVALERAGRALRILREGGILGDGLRLQIVRGAGAFVCGEETALLAALSGGRGTPRFRPPFPSEKGFRGRPTLVNNVETFALVPWIIREGAGKFAALGSGRSRGTKTFALSGKVRRGGLIEVEMGTTLGAVIGGIGGGAQEDKKVKAVQVGGPSGGCVPASLLDTPVDYEALSSAGAFMGSGGMVVLDEDDCMVDIARYFLEFSRRESCGACVWCRVGTTRMSEILERICSGAGREGDLRRLEELCGLVSGGSLCGLGRSAPNPVLSTLRHFRSEYEEHVKGRCPAGRCRALIRYEISDECIGCTKCYQACPSKAIAFTPFERHRIDPEKCTKCGLCARVCPSGAARVIT